MNRSTLTERRAIWVYEAARLEAVASLRPIVPEEWNQRDLTFREQFVRTIERICVPGYETTPEAEHESWMRAYVAMGWAYGPVRSQVEKTHPDMVPFDQLPAAEQGKDEIFLQLCFFASRYIQDVTPCDD